MRGQWIFVLLCLSLVGELVLGSIFPGQDNPPTQEKNSQTEVQLPNVATIPEVIFNEAKTTTRDLNAEDKVQEKQRDSNEDNAPRINTPTTIIIYSEQKSTVDNATTNVARVSTKMSPFIN